MGSKNFTMEATFARLLNRWTLVTAIFLAVLVMAFPADRASADDKQEAIQLVEKARITFDNFLADKNMEPFHDLVKQASGVLISPQVLKGAFILGASGGSGVLVRRDKSGHWVGPAFYTVGGVSFGLQIGGTASEVVLLVMTERGISSLLSSSLKLGADVGVAAGPVGIGASAATANISADILSFSISKGLYGGLSLDGSVVAIREDWNHAYYGKEASATDILIRQEVTNPQANRLIEKVAKAAEKR